ncbi:MAG: preprotein translocase subunit YajC [Gammaproteobacteria bacterium]
MSFLISQAHAQAGAPPGGGMLEFAIMIGIFFAIMYFMIIRPQSKRAKEHKQLLESLTRGDEVVTSGGVLGRLADVGESFVRMEIAAGVNIMVQKHAIASVMPKGTIKADAPRPDRSRKEKGKGNP